MTLRQQMLRGETCQEGLEFIANNPHTLDMEMADLWDAYRDSNPMFMGWCVSLAPRSPQKLKAWRLVQESGALTDEAKNHDLSVMLKCFGWMSNPYREAT